MFIEDRAPLFSVVMSPDLMVGESSDTIYAGTLIAAYVLEI
jgi:hypothetical protein|tara:strand:- start:13 stop:135 length:123 start_codon:yes stop_codon:yes gene_type:complete